MNPDKPQAIRCEYWGTDLGRKFEILVEGKQIAQQELRGDKGERFFTAEYAIPADLIKGKQKITVRFESASNTTWVPLGLGADPAVDGTDLGEHAAVLNYGKEPTECSESARGRAVIKVVYMVLEPQYQNALTNAATTINEQNSDLAIELSGYLIEELWDPSNYADFCSDVAAADVFIASQIFIPERASLVVRAVAPHRDRLKAVVVFSSRPDLMRLNKLGTFSMAQLGQSKSAIAKREEAGGAGFQDVMLKLLNTLPTVLSPSNTTVGGVFGVAVVNGK